MQAGGESLVLDCGVGGEVRGEDCGGGEGVWTVVFRGVG